MSIWRWELDTGWDKVWVQNPEGGKLKVQMLKVSCRTQVYSCTLGEWTIDFCFCDGNYVSFNNRHMDYVLLLS